MSSARKLGLLSCVAAMLALLPLSAFAAQDGARERRKPSSGTTIGLMGPATPEELAGLERDIAACEKAPRFADDCLDLIDSAAQNNWSADDWNTAEVYYRRAVEIRRKAFGPDALEVADGQYALGYFLVAIDKPAKAEGPLAAALARYEAEGPKHHWLGVGNLLLAEAIDAQGRYADAEPYYRNAVRFSTILEGERADRTRGMIGALGLNLRKQGSFAEADPVLRRHLALERATGEAGMIAKALAQLARNQGDLGRAAEGEAMLREAVALWESYGMTDISPLVLKARAELAGFLLRKSGKSADALTELRRTTVALLARERDPALTGMLADERIYLRYHVEAAWRVAAERR